MPPSHMKVALSTTTRSQEERLESFLLAWTKLHLTGSFVFDDSDGRSRTRDRRATRIGLGPQPEASTFVILAQHHDKLLDSSRAP